MVAADRALWFARAYAFGISVRRTSGTVRRRRHTRRFQLPARAGVAASVPGGRARRGCLAGAPRDRNGFVASPAVAPRRRRGHARGPRQGSPQDLLPRCARQHAAARRGTRADPGTARARCAGRPRHLRPRGRAGRAAGGPVGRLVHRAHHVVRGRRSRQAGSRSGSRSDGPLVHVLGHCGDGGRRGVGRQSGVPGRGHLCRSPQRRNFPRRIDRGRRGAVFEDAQDLLDHLESSPLARLLDS
ncbi:Uncharacterised protein [Rhodococcus wratislaviensis]|uniref:Uncharacterized protein n=1 Tax=Rhodococcus wratislaviensis TaxID=44752 RepID=A0AB38F4V4_RHOWR|nr:Uncharacterised protein [Rhodococcus wratislaviensis]